MSRAAVLTDPHRGDRRGLRGRMLFPRHAVVDPALTLSAEPDLTARTGFDALTHAIESYVSPKARSATDELALRAMRIVSEFLPAALNDPTDIAFREQLAWAATTMGVNLATVGTCLPHRLDKALCALRPHLAHGRSLATIYAHWARLSWRGNPERFAAIAEILQPATASLRAEERAACFEEAVTSFLHRIGLAAGAAELNVTDDEIPLLAGLVTGDLQANPVAIRREDLPGIFRAILRP